MAEGISDPEWDRRGGTAENTALGEEKSQKERNWREWKLGAERLTALPQTII